MVSDPVVDDCSGFALMATVEEAARLLDCGRADAHRFTGRFSVGMTRRSSRRDLQDCRVLLGSA